MSALGEPLPVSSLDHIEKGKSEPGVRRLFYLLRLYGVPVQMVAELAELEEASIEPPVDIQPEKAYREGLEHLQRGEFQQGLAFMLAVRHRRPEGSRGKTLRQQATLSFAIAARNLGRYRLANTLLEELLSEAVDPSVLANVLLEMGTVWFALGSTEAALAFYGRASSYIPAGDDRMQGLLQHLMGRVHLVRSELDQADQLLRRALELYRRAGDTLNESKARLVMVQLLEARGNLKAAIAEADAVRAGAQRRRQAFPAMIASLRKGRLLIQAGQAEEGLGLLREALAEAVRIGDRATEFFAHYHIWKAYEATGDPARAAVALESARYYVQFVQEHSPEAVEVRAFIPKGRVRRTRKKPARQPARRRR